MGLINAFNIKNKDIITIVGAGGKTSLMFSASSLLRKNYKVLVTTTTNIYVPEEKFYDEMIMLSDGKYNKISKENENCNNKKYDNEKYHDIAKNNKNGVYVIGNYIVNNSKVKGLTFEQLDKITPYFDIVIIEGDGSKEKCLKGWNDTEPVIYPKTTKTIGVVDIASIGMDINEDNIHRLDRFLDIINDKTSDKVKVEHLKNVVLSKSGLFKMSIGKKILFVNKVENIENKEHTLQLIKHIKNENTSYIDKFIYGSILKSKFHVYI